MKFQYKFKKGKKGICPNCGKRTLTLYVDEATSKTMPDKYGKCERVNSCGYWHKPQFEDKTFFVSPLTIPKKPSYIDSGIVDLTLGHEQSNVLYKWLCSASKVAPGLIRNTFYNYNVGTAKDCGVIFWQKDYSDRYRTGKLMYYLPDGHRNKNKFGNWIHSLIKSPDFNLKQTLFGMHLLANLPDGSEIAIVESEKTALILNIFKGITALATGGASNFGLIEQNKNILNNFNCNVLPDIGFQDVWEKKITELGCENIKIFKWWEEMGIDLNASENSGKDIADFLI